jgi:hypothetical protein
VQWRVAGWLSGIPFTTLHNAFARWTRLACSDEVLPPAVVADSCSLRSAPTSWTRNIDGGKLVKGVKLLAVCDKHGFCNGPLDVNPLER